MTDTIEGLDTLMSYAAVWTVEDAITAAVAMIEEHVGDDATHGNQPFFAACRKELETQGFTLCETDTGECEWSVRIFEPIKL